MWFLYPPPAFFVVVHCIVWGYHQIGVRIETLCLEWETARSILQELEEPLMYISAQGAGACRRSWEVRAQNVKLQSLDFTNHKLDGRDRSKRSFSVAVY